MKNLMTAFLFLAIPASAAMAQDEGEAKKDTRNVYRPHFSYNFRYPDVMSRDNLTDQTLLASEGLARGLDWLIEKNYPGGARGFQLVAGLALAIFDEALAISEHEQGHSQAFAKAGIGSSHFRYFDHANQPHSAGNCWEMLGNVMAYGGFGLTGSTTGIDTAGWTEFDSNPHRLAHKNQFLLAMFAGGLNQQQFSVERISERVLDGEEIVLDFPMWVSHFIGTMSYSDDKLLPGNDIYNFVDYAGKLGVRTSASQIRNVQWLKLLSGSTIAMAYGLGNFLWSGETKIAPWLNGWPEFASYLTESGGVTLKISDPIRCGENVWVEPIYQFSLNKGGCQEFGLRVREKVSELISYSVAGFANQRGGTWIEGDVAFYPLPWLEIAVGAYRGRGYTYQRDISGSTFSFLKNSEWSPKASIGLALRF